MLPRLQAEEQLKAIDAAMLAAGNHERHVAVDMLRGLRRKASGDQQPAAAKPTVADLRAMGIAVIEAPPSAGEAHV